MTAKVIGPDKTHYDGPVTAISTVNDQGELSLLPHHMNFISLIKDNVTLYSGKRTKHVIPLGQGVLYCYNDAVEIYLDISATAPKKPSSGR